MEKFAAHPHMKDGRQIFCKDCMKEEGLQLNESGRVWRAKDPDRTKRSDESKFATYYMMMNRQMWAMLNNVRSRAMSASVECSLTPEWILERLEKGECEATGLPFDVQTDHGRRHPVNSFSPSIERIDTEGSYSPDNCIMVGVESKPPL